MAYSSTWTTNQLRGELAGVVGRMRGVRKQSLSDCRIGNGESKRYRLFAAETASLGEAVEMPAVSRPLIERLGKALSGPLVDEPALRGFDTSQTDMWLGRDDGKELLTVLRLIAMHQLHGGFSGQQDVFHIFQGLKVRFETEQQERMNDSFLQPAYGGLYLPEPTLFPPEAGADGFIRKLKEFEPKLDKAAVERVKKMAAGETITLHIAKDGGEWSACCVSKWENGYEARYEEVTGDLLRGETGNANLVIVPSTDRITLKVDSEWWYPDDDREPARADEEGGPAKGIREVKSLLAAAAKLGYFFVEFELPGVCDYTKLAKEFGARLGGVESRKVIGTAGEIIRLGPEKPAMPDALNPGHFLRGDPTVVRESIPLYENMAVRMPTGNRHELVFPSALDQFAFRQRNLEEAGSLTGVDGAYCRFDCVSLGFTERINVVIEGKDGSYAVTFGLFLPTSAEMGKSQTSERDIVEIAKGIAELHGDKDRTMEFGMKVAEEKKAHYVHFATTTVEQGETVFCANESEPDWGGK